MSMQKQIRPAAAERIDPAKADWSRACADATALVLLPFLSLSTARDKPSHSGVTVLHRGGDGTSLYGCRDITRLPGRDAEFASCVAAWVSGAREHGLEIEDHAGACDAVREIANRLIKDVSGDRHDWQAGEAERKPGTETWFVPIYTPGKLEATAWGHTQQEAECNARRITAS